MGYVCMGLFPLSTIHFYSSRPLTSREMNNLHLAATMLASEMRCPRLFTRFTSKSSWKLNIYMLQGKRAQAEVRPHANCFTRFTPDTLALLRPVSINAINSIIFAKYYQANYSLTLILVHVHKFDT